MLFQEWCPFFKGKIVLFRLRFTKFFFRGLTQSWLCLHSLKQHTDLHPGWGKVPFWVNDSRRGNAYQKVLFWIRWGGYISCLPCRWTVCSLSSGWKGQKVDFPETSSYCKNIIYQRQNIFFNIQTSKSKIFRSSNYHIFQFNSNYLK